MLLVLRAAFSERGVGEGIYHRQILPFWLEFLFGGRGLVRPGCLPKGDCVHLRLIHCMFPILAVSRHAEVGRS